MSRGFRQWTPTCRFSASFPQSLETHMLRSSLIGIGLAVTTLLAFQVTGCGDSGGGGVAGTTGAGGSGSGVAGTTGTGGSGSDVAGTTGAGGSGSGVAGTTGTAGTAGTAGE